jgi:hypothetical protein
MVHALKMSGPGTQSASAPSVIRRAVREKEILICLVARKDSLRA